MPFHIHVPKPLHGWKAMFNEVFVIVIGVLIALGLEAGVEWLHWQHKVADGRERMREELKRAYITSALQITYAPCVLAQLDRIRDHLLDPSTPPLVTDHYPGNDAVLRTPTGASSTSTWKALLNDGTLLHFPIGEQRSLNVLYGGIETENAHALETGEASGRLLAAGYKGQLPEQLRAELLMQVAAQYRRTQSLVINSLNIMLALKDKGYSVSDAEVDASVLPLNPGGFRTPSYCREQKLPTADWKGELQRLAASARPQ